MKTTTAQHIYKRFKQQVTGGVCAKAVAMDNFLQHVSFMITRWAVIEKGVKNISTISPELLLLDKSTEGFSYFIDRLCQIKDVMQEDFTSFVTPMCVDSSQINTELEISVRYCHRVTWLGLCRLIDALKHLPTPSQGRTLRDMYAYFACILLPPKDIYHDHKMTIAVDLLHEVYTLATLHHIGELPPSESTNITIDQVENRETSEKTDRDTVSTTPIISNKPDVNELLQYAAILESFPIIPDDLMGEIFSTTQTRIHTDLNVLMQGVESRCHVKKLADKRTCIACKVDNISIGLTDVNEQNAKKHCRCLFTVHDSITDTFYDSAYISRAATLSRLLLFNKTAIPKAYGCSCDEHNTVFNNRITLMKQALDLAHVVND